MRGVHADRASRRAYALYVCTALLSAELPCLAAPGAARDGAESDGSRRLPLAGWSGGVHSLTLLDLAGEDISERLEPREQDGRVSLRVTGAEPFIAKPKQLQTLVLADSERTVLPGGFVVTVPAAATRAPLDGEAPEVKLVWFRITVGASPLPAPWNDPAQSYGTQLSFGLRSPANSPTGLKPPGGVLVRLAFDGATAEDVPPIVLDEPGIDHEKTIALRFRPTEPAPKLLVRSSISDVNLELRAQPRLEVRPVQSEVLGLGLAPVEVNIQRVAPDGAGLATSEATPLLLQVSRAARLEPATPMLAPGESRTVFSLRSGGLGAIRIQAKAGSYAGAATVQQRFPIAPLAAALLGGGLGGFARRFVKGSRRSAGGRRIIEGLVVSSIAFVAGVLGVNYFDSLPAALVATEAGSFLTGALSGFVGVLLLEGLSATKTPSRGRAASGAL